MQRFVKPIGTINGTNVNFSTLTPYIADSLRVFVNGIMRVSQYDNGFLEADPSSGTFLMKKPPLPNDTLMTFYDEA